MRWLHRTLQLTDSPAFLSPGAEYKLEANGVSEGRGGQPGPPTLFMFPGALFRWLTQPWLEAITSVKATVQRCHTDAHKYTLLLACFSTWFLVLILPCFPWTQCVRVWSATDILKVSFSKSRLSWAWLQSFRTIRPLPRCGKVFHVLNAGFSNNEHREWSEIQKDYNMRGDTLTAMSKTVLGVFYTIWHGGREAS